MFNLPLLFRPFRPKALGYVGLSALIALGTGWGSETLAQTPSANPPANPTLSGGRIVRPTLRLGSQGDSVYELQSMLVLLGYYPGPVSGVYQEATALAVQRFQQAAAITADGIVGPATWSKLFPAPAAEVTPPGQAVAPNPAPDNPPATTPPSSPPPTTTPSSPPATQPSSPPSSSPSPPITSATLPILRPGMEGDAVRFLQQRLRAKQVYSGPISGFFGPQTEAAVRQLQQTNTLLVDGIVGPATWNVLH
ncbi:MAG: peptidoglycan-binding protein [Leptolyngbya sp.]|nr:peptidoglycan-binding protein [Leptolyngbya sp.]